MSLLERKPDITEKQALLLKLKSHLEDLPDHSFQGWIDGRSALRLWLAKAGALLKRFDALHLGNKFESKMMFLGNYPEATIHDTQGMIFDVIAEIELELELQGRSDIGSAYAPGDVYRYFADLKQIIAGARDQVFLVDPYFNGRAFDDYLADSRTSKSIRILANRYANEISPYAKKYSAQYGATVEVRNSAELHDRVVMIDQDQCWVSGGSIKDAGKKPTYLIPLAPEIGTAKYLHYEAIWDNATQIA